MSDDPLDIPPFLRRDENPKRAPAPRATAEHEWVMPPIALGAVARAIRAGCDTMQKIRKRTRERYNNHEIKQALHALVRSGDITRHGRRYASSRRQKSHETTAPENPETPTAHGFSPARPVFISPRTSLREPLIYQGFPWHRDVPPFSVAVSH